MEADFTSAVLLTETIARSTPEPTTHDIVSRWHAEAGHIGSFEHCSEQPCRAISRSRSV